MGFFDGLPSGWSSAKDASGDTYYFNRTTGESSYTKPEKEKKPAKVDKLPANWQEADDGQGGKYYWNTATNETSYTRPVAAPTIKKAKAIGLTLSTPDLLKAAAPPSGPPPGGGCRRQCSSSQRGLSLGSALRPPTGLSQCSSLRRRRSTAAGRAATLCTNCAWAHGYGPAALAGFRNTLTRRSCCCRP